jgi:hypothetical protein
VWEVDSQHQLGDQFHPPAGAAVPGGDGFTYTDENLRRAVVIGEQAAARRTRQPRAPARRCTTPG